MLTARRYHGHADGAPQAEIALGYDARFLRRKVLTLPDGARLLVDLPQVTSLDHGGVLITEDGAEIAIVAAPEQLAQVRGSDLVRLAWHIGNRHTPCQIEADRLLIQRDRVIEQMLIQLGADVTGVTEPFKPEGGAYGHGRTQGHDHGHVHSPASAHDHDH